MNERIRELIKQADIEFDVSSDHYGIDTAVVIPAVVIPYDLEKFAELLIRECAHFITETATIETLLGDRLKEHFGVE